MTRMTQLLLISDGFYADFYGWDVALFYIYSLRSFMQEYSWQVRLSFAIILMCCVTMLILLCLFSYQIRKRKNHQRDYDHCYNTYSEHFIEILEEPTRLSEQQIIEMCDEDENGFSYYDGLLYAEVITHIRMMMNETLYFPNLQLLCEVTGALSAIEQRLKKRKDVLSVLQMVNTLPLNINEGLLAVYTAHPNKKISTLARVAYCMCSQTEPYQYLLHDMNKPQSSWYRITIHRIMGWKMEQKYPMPPLLMLAQTSENPQMAAFLTEEISYWGTDEEKRQLVSFFTDPRLQCRIAAIRSLTRLRFEDTEEKIMASYESQPQLVRREMLKAIASFHSGRYVEFFVNVYLNTPSHESRRVALKCLYNYNEEGRRRFEELARLADDKNSILFNQIRTLHQLHS